MNIKGILFDLDGTLVDAPLWHRLALDMALDECGERILTEEEYQKYNGLGTTEKLRLMFGPGHEKRIEKINKLKQQRTQELIEERCRPVPHIIEAVEYALFATGDKIAIVTNCLRPTTLKMLELSGLRSMFDVIVTASDVRKKKPSPIPYRQAAAHIGLIPHVCLAVDDSRHGIESARAARCDVWELTSMKELTKENLRKKLGNNDNW